MPRSRRVLAAVSAVALLGAGASAAPARAAAVKVTLGCIVFVDDYKAPAIPVFGTGFTPNAVVTLRTMTASRPEPRFLGSGRADAGGNLIALTGAAIFRSDRTRDQRFYLSASDGLNVAGDGFRQVRLGYDRVPASGSPDRRVKHIARGFTPGQTVWTHFRHRGKTRATRRLGRARGPCGIARRKMRALPVRRPSLGLWKVFVDEREMFSRDSWPQVRQTFEVELQR